VLVAGHERTLERVRDAVLDPKVDLLAPWTSFLAGEPDAVVVVLESDALVHAATGDAQAWLIQPTEVVKLAKAGLREALAGRLVVASADLFRQAPQSEIERIVRTSSFGAVGDALVALVGGVAVLVAER